MRDEDGTLLEGGGENPEPIRPNEGRYFDRCKKHDRILNAGEECPECEEEKK